MQTNAPTPMTLDQLPAFGAVWFGMGVRMVKLELDDGRVMKLELPVQVEAEEVDQKTGLESSETAEQILQVLSSLRSGEWMGALALAMEIDEDLDHKGGTFKRAIKQLRDKGKIESSRQHGYRLKS